MRGDRRNQVAGASVMMEEDALSQSPQRSGTELVPACSTLGNVIVQPRSHVMDFQITK